MTDKQLAFKDDELIRILNRVYDLFRDGRIPEASASLEEALKIDFDYPGVTAAMKCANFWGEKQKKLAETEDGYEKGEYLLEQWGRFTAFTARMPDVSEKCIYSLKGWVFGAALQCYKRLYEQSSVCDAEVLLKIGRCFKGIGDYMSAIEYLEIANQQKSDMPAVLAELADCYAQINELRASKVFFREAFFIDPQQVDLNRIETAMIKRLAGKLKEKGLSGAELMEWLPVYGAVYGVFNVKRELRPIEFGKLKQSIFRLETALKKDKDAAGHLVPRLIKHYFWLIDHYVATGEEKAKIEDVLEKVKGLEPTIYREYAK